MVYISSDNQSCSFLKQILKINTMENQTLSLKYCDHCFIDLKFGKNDACCPLCGNDDLSALTEEDIDEFIASGWVVEAAGMLTRYKSMNISEAADYCKRFELTLGKFHLPLKSLFDFLEHNEHLETAKRKMYMTQLVYELNKMKFGWNLIMSKEFVELMLENYE
jgi:pyruvate-formate lyase-activating enzyme